MDFGRLNELFLLDLFECVFPFCWGGGGGVGGNSSLNFVGLGFV